MQRSFYDLIAITICTLVWGTTWYAITLQLGAVDPVISLVYRFGLAAALLFAWCGLRREPRGLSAAQHLAALGVGLFTFTLDYTFIYWAEARVSSAVVALVFASLSFCNLIGFRLAFGQRAARSAWVAATLGIVGVLILSWGELSHTHLSARTLEGLLLVFGAVLGASVGNIFARRGEQAGAPLAASTAWAMTYGTLLLALYAVLTGKTWSFQFKASYVLSLLHLSLMGSVVAFLLYYGIARRRGYSTASYISALTPLLAMVISTLFEGKKWGKPALIGVALVLLGQWLLLRKPRS